MKAIVIYKKSTFELYSESPDESTRAYALGRPGMLESHNIQQETLAEVYRALDSECISHRDFYRGKLEDMKGGVIANADLVVVVGGDGTMLELCHYVRDCSVPVLGVNSDPKNSVGFYAHCNATTFAQELVSLDDIPLHNLSRLKFSIDGVVQPEFVLNELAFSHAHDGTPARYQLKIDGQDLVDGRENTRLRSSGVLIGTGAGSSAWMLGAGGVLYNFDSRRIQIIEREARLGPLFANTEVELISGTREGHIVIDGQFVKYDLTLDQKIHVGHGTPLRVYSDFEGKRKRFVNPPIRKLR